MPLIILMVLLTISTTAALFLYLMHSDAKADAQIAKGRAQVLGEAMIRERRNSFATITILKNDLKKARQLNETLIALGEIERDLDVQEEIEEMTDPEGDNGIGN